MPSNSPSKTRRHPLRSGGRFAAAIVGLGALAFAGLFGYGAVNPRQYVFFLTYFNDPFAGAALVLAILTVAFILGFPVRSTVIDRRRSIARTTMVILTVIATILFLFAYELAVFRYSSEVLATSPNGQRSIARVQRVEGHRDAGVRRQRPEPS